MQSTILQPHEIRLVTVILPTYNEVENIVPLIHAVNAAVSFPLEIIVVDDHSPDGTAEAARRAQLSNVRVEERMSDHGLTKSIQHGIDCAKGDTIVWMDCDFSMPPKNIPELLKKIEDGYFIAVGSRFVPGGMYKQGVEWFGSEESAFGVLLSRFINFCLRYALNPRFRDYTSGFIAVRSDVFKDIRLVGDYGEYFIDLMYRAMLLGYSFVEVPYICEPRRAGVSKTGTTFRQLFRRGVPYLQMIWRCWKLSAKKKRGESITDQR